MAFNARQKSSQLYDLLEDVGVSEKSRLLSRNMAVIFEIMETIIACQCGPSNYRIVSGSRYEGSYIPGMMPDLDMIMLDGKVFLEAHNDQSSLLVVQDEYIHPGYVKLQLSLNSQPQTIFNNPSFKPDCEHELDCMGRVCYKGWHVEGMNGPAFPIFDDTQKHAVDMVFGKFSETIPHFAKGWFSRNRRNGWPSYQQIQEMMEMGCVYVYVGHEWSAESVVEWRLSFTRQERMLISNLNPVQHKVFVLLKIIKKHVIQPKYNEEVLTSYHCKTCILYMAENIPEKLWTVDNLVGCLIACLKTIYRWVINRFCPNFFMQDQNLFAKTVFRRNRHTLAHTLKEMIELDDTIIDLIYREYIDAKQIHTDKILRNEIFKADLVLLPLFCVKVDHFFVLLDRDIDSVRLYRLVRYLQQIKRVSFHTAEETRQGVSFFLSLVFFYLGRAILSEFVSESTHSEKVFHIDTAYYYLTMAKQTGQVSPRLFLASFLFRMKKFEICSVILRSVEFDLEQSVYQCSCLSKFFIAMSNDLVSFYGRQPIEIIFGKVERCIEFFPHEKEITPLALQLEMLRDKDVDPGSTDHRYERWFKHAFVDPYSFLYFMQYLVGLSLNRCVAKNIALGKLSRIAKDKRAFHRETTYNLLGWAYIQERQIGNAIQCFMESWRKRPNYNAAKLHLKTLSILFYRLICKWQQI